MLNAILMLWACGTPGPVDVALEDLHAGREAHLRTPYGEPVGDAAIDRLLHACQDPTLGSGAVELLIEAGIRGDTAAARGANVIRRPRIIAGLVELAVRGEETAQEALWRNVPSEDLRAYAAELAPLTTEGTPLATKVAAKAGAGTLADVPRTHEHLPLRAALGDPEAERTLLEALEQEDPTTKAKAIARLGEAGTPGALAALARLLRSPLRRPVGTDQEQSLRVDVLQALHYHWPQEPALFASKLVSDKHYARAERFIATQTGVEPSGDRPPFFVRGPVQR